MPLENLTLKWLFDHCPPDIIALVIVAVLVSWLTIRVNKYLSGGIGQVERLATIEKQQRKLEQLIESCPCVSKANATWLQDKVRNGGQPPEKICCHYLAAIERDEK